jgi:chromosome segregation ATPase
MKKVLIFCLILMLPADALAAYKIYLKNGSDIPEVHSYEEKGDKVNIYFSGGTLTIMKKDILRIEGEETEELRPAPAFSPDDWQPEEEKKKESPEATNMPSPVQETANEKSVEIKALNTELDTINSDLRAAEEKESKLVATINERAARRIGYNTMQYKQLEKELAPLRQDLHSVEQRKADLIKKRSEIENKVRSLE